VLEKPAFDEFGGEREAYAPNIRRLSVRLGSATASGRDGS
jgi:hypothetical protein